jgi:hypothetical protein
MGHYAKIDENNIVIQVNVVDEEFFETNPDRYTGRWIKTSYNNNIRKNFAGIGYTYNFERDAFIAPQPYTKWILNEETCQWEAPTPYPTDDKRYVWNDNQGEWEEYNDTTSN